MSRWFRVYDDVINDPKILKLPDESRWHWIALLCIASKNEGALPSTEDVAISLRVKPASAAAIIAGMKNAGLLDLVDDRYVPHNWDGRQFKSDTSNERVKRYRQRKCNVTETVTVTPPDTEADTEAEQSRPRAALSNEEKVLRTDLMEAFGADRTPNLSKAGEWLSKGYSSTMILEVVRELLARKPDISSLAYFEPKLAERHANQPLSPTERVKAEAEIDFERVVAMFKKGGPWSKYAGPEPGQTGCKCPPEILARHGFAPLLKAM